MGFSAVLVPQLMDRLLLLLSPRIGRKLERVRLIGWFYLSNANEERGFEFVVAIHTVVSLLQLSQRSPGLCIVYVRVITGTLFHQS